MIRFVSTEPTDPALKITRVPKGYPAIYLIEDTGRGWVKVGFTTNIAGRMAQYRANGDTQRVLRAAWESPSPEEGLRVEGLIIEELSTRFIRPCGDWFACTIDEAMIAMRHEKRGRKLREAVSP